MALYPFYAYTVDAQGDITTGTAVEVRDAAGSLATLYNQDGTSLSNPFTSGSEADVLFYAAQGTYAVTTGSGASEQTVTVQLGPIVLGDVDAVIADSSLAYSPTGNQRPVIAGDVIRTDAEGFSYEVAASAASDQDLTTSGGVKLYVLPVSDGSYAIDAFGAAGDGSTDDTDAFIQAAGDGGRRLVLAAKTYVCEGSSNAGAPTADTFNIPSNTSIVGQGRGATIMKRPTSSTARGIFSAENGTGSTDIADATVDLVEDVTIRGITFQGDVVTLGHSENKHLISVSGIKNWLIEDCEFRGAQGDGIYIGAGMTGGSQYRFNFNVTIRDCYFDGELNGNDGGRNAISVIDVEGMEVSNCEFRKWSRNDMPGSFCLEPNRAEERIKNVTVRGCRFYDTAGNRGHCALSLDNSNPENISRIMILDNYADGEILNGEAPTGYSAAFNNFVNIYTDEDAASFPTTKTDITIANNRTTNLRNMVEAPIGYIDGLYIENNVTQAIETGSSGNIILGNSTTDWELRNVYIVDNRMRVDNPSVVSLRTNLNTVVIRGNTLDGPTQEHILFGFTGGNSEKIYIEDNLYLDTPGNSPSRAANSDGVVDWAQGSYYRNKGDITNHLLAFLQSDYLGGRFNVTDFSDAPSAFPPGISRCEIQGSAGASDGPNTSENYGMLVTYKMTTSNGDDAAYQFFYPEYDRVGYADRNSAPYFRKEVAGAWGSWRQIAVV